MAGLKIYEINANYVKYLSVYQNHLFFSDGDKAGRKYIGIDTVNTFSQNQFYT